VSLHIPWDRPRDASELKQYAASRGLGFDAMNSNTFQDQAGQKAVLQVRLALPHRQGDAPAGGRAQSRMHRDRQGARLQGADGVDRRRLQLPRPEQLHQGVRALPGLGEADLRQLPHGWKLFVEHKMYEPAFYSTVIQDWGTNYLPSTSIGDDAYCLVDLGHHAPNVNIEMIVARLIQFGRLGGFHFNDSKYGDDDLDTGTIDPFRLFLVFNELVDAELRRAPRFEPAHMLDQSHNVTDPIESLIRSANEIRRAYAQACWSTARRWRRRRTATIRCWRRRP
jgi:L-rhamnose isomerase/sugar isomerase